MNHYPGWWNTTITLFNKFTGDDKKVVWYPRIIEGCFYNHKLEKITVGRTTIEANVSVCRIRVDDDFVGKGVWNELPDASKREQFTLGVGDIIVAGEVDFEIDEYTNGKRSSDLIKKYSEWPGCFTVETVNINVGGGRGNEHYHARGT